MKIEVYLSHYSFLSDVVLEDPIPDLSTLLMLIGENWIGLSLTEV